MIKEYFTRADGSDELACRCGCGMTVNDGFRRLLNLARQTAKTPFKINSGARCIKHNSQYDKDGTSSHVKGIAADIAYDSELNLVKIIHALTLTGVTRIGVNEKKKFVHIDVDFEKPSLIFSY